MGTRLSGGPCRHTDRAERGFAVVLAALPLDDSRILTKRQTADTGSHPMLVLSRKESQRIKLGESIVVTVVRVMGDKVRLGIEAPSDVLILREELDPRETPAVFDQEEETFGAGDVERHGFTAAQPV